MQMNEKSARKLLRGQHKKRKKNKDDVFLSIIPRRVAKLVPDPVLFVLSKCKRWPAGGGGTLLRTAHQCIIQAVVAHYPFHPYTHIRQFFFFFLFHFLFLFSFTLKLWVNTIWFFLCFLFSFNGKRYVLCVSFSLHQILQY